MKNPQMAMHETLKEAARAHGGILSWPAFTRIALYHPELGYYRRERQRVGKGEGSDFYTASSLGLVFGQLIAAAAQDLLGADFCRDAVLVEIGAEPQGSPLAEMAKDFSGYRAIRVGEAVAIPEKSVVVSNELLDAQPFHRFLFREGQWREIGVAVADNLQETELPEPTQEAAAFLKTLPTDLPEGTRLDISLEAETLLRSITEGDWQGALIFFDYGRTLAELLQASPRGTARGYYRHEAVDDLLARPGEQDLTCHVCWDRLEAVLAGAGFADVRVDAQESFLMRQGKAAVARIIEQKPGAFDPDRQALMGLVSPNHLGRKFQVLHGLR